MTSKRDRALELIRQAEALAGGARALVREIETEEDEHGVDPFVYHVSRSVELLGSAIRCFGDATCYLVEVQEVEDG